MRRPLLVIFPFKDQDPAVVEAFALPVISGRHRREKGGSEDRQAAYFAGRASLAAGLRHLNLKAQVEPDPDFGFLKVSEGPSNLYVNVSHTRKIAVGVVARVPIGVDVEAIDRRVGRVMERVSAPSEFRYHVPTPLSAEGGEVPQNVALWSAKESFSKALGLGIKFGMQALEISFEGAPPYAAKTELHGPLAVTTPAIHLLRHGEFVISVCTERALLEGGVEILFMGGLPAQ